MIWWVLHPESTNQLIDFDSFADFGRGATVCLNQGGGCYEEEVVDAMTSVKYDEDEFKGLNVGGITLAFLQTFPRW